MQTHKNLEVWNDSMDLVELIYQSSRNFPDDEKFVLVPQIRRAAVSIPSNIAEGYARNSRKYLIQFLYISLGSLSELETQILISKRLKFSLPEGILDQIVMTRRKLLNLIKYHKFRLK